MENNRERICCLFQYVFLGLIVLSLFLFLISFVSASGVYLGFGGSNSFLQSSNVDFQFDNPNQNFSISLFFIAYSNLDFLYSSFDAVSDGYGGFVDASNHAVVQYQDVLCSGVTDVLDDSWHHLVVSYNINENMSVYVEHWRILAIYQVKICL
jgi:hypothetical protein